MMKMVYRSRPGSWNWIPEADKNGDNIADHLDMAIVRENIQLKLGDWKILNTLLHIIRYEHDLHQI